MKTDKIVDSKVTIMTDLGGEKSKTLLLKNETEIEAFKEQLRVGGVSQQRELLKAFYAYIDYKWAIGMLTDKVDKVIEGFDKSL
mgnify:CR=1 FL=1